MFLMNVKIWNFNRLVIKLRYNFWYEVKLRKYRMKFKLNIFLIYFFGIEYVFYLLKNYIFWNNELMFFDVIE